MTGTMIARALMGILGLLLALGGLAVAAAGYSLFALSLVAGGVILMVASVFEVMRYRSESAEANRGRPGPGGGEPDRPEGRFRPTDEVFVDPTTHKKMRVYSDSSTGERRYVAEG
jgi:predicted lipid-binding transport protein (Tim44 family)